MSEDDGHESGCDTVEGSPTSDTSTSPHSNSTYHYLDNSNHNSRPPLAAMVAPQPSPAVQGRSPRGVRTMVVPPLRVQNSNTQGTEERVQRMGQWKCFFQAILGACAHFVTSVIWYRTLTNEYIVYLCIFYKPR